MNALALIDPGVSGRLCLMLLHSVWQLALLATVAWAVQRLFLRSVHSSYALHVVALTAGLAALPITYLLLDAPATNPKPPGLSQFALSEHRPGTPLNLPVPSTVPIEAAVPITNTVNPQVSEDHHTVTAGPSETVSAADSWVTLAPWIVLAYVCGACMMFGRLCFSLWSARRLVRQSEPITERPVLERFHTLAQRCSLSIRPALARTCQIAVPKAVGLLKPTILLPSAALSGLTPEQLEMILIHELTHLRRHDLWINLLQRVAEVVLFFNPALWYLSRRISTLREFCCDEMTCRTITTTTTEPTAGYALALLQVAELSQQNTAGGRPRRAVDPSELATLAANGRSPSELRRRVAHLFGEPILEPLRISRGSLFAVAAIALLTMFGPLMWPTAAQTPDDAKTEADADAAGNAAKQFSFGSKVDIIALGTHNEAQQQWWDAEGRPLEAVPFTWEQDGNVGSNEPLWRRIVYRLTDLPEDAEVKWNIVGAHASAGGKVTLKDNQPTDGYYSRYFGTSDQQQEITLRVGVATGDWKTVTKIGAFGEVGHGEGEKSLIASGTMRTDDGTVIIISHNYLDQNFRVIAVDKQGNEYPSISSGGFRVSKIYQTKATFPKLLVNPDDITRFEFQVRDYEWVEAKGLPLEPKETGDALGKNEPNDEEAQTYNFPVSINGRAIDERGKPVADAEIVLVSRCPGYRRIAETKSDETGTYRFQEIALPIQRANTVNGEGFGEFEIFGLADGYAFAWRSKKGLFPDVSHKVDRAIHDNSDPDSVSQFGRNDPISLDLTFRSPKTLRGRIIDDQGKPIANAKLVLRDCEIWWNPNVEGNVYLGRNLDSLNDNSIVPARIKRRTTDEEGLFEFTGLPADYYWKIDVRPPGHTRRTIWAITRNGVNTDARGKRVYSGDFEVVFPRTRRMKFLVVDKETAEPLAKVGVGSKVSEVSFWETTDEGGLFEVNLPDGEFTLGMFPRIGTPYWRSEAAVVVSEDTAQTVNILHLRRAAVVNVTVLDSRTRKPLSGVDLWLEQSFAGFDKPIRDVHGYRSWEVETRLSRYESPRTDADGKMRVLFEPGTHHIGIGKEAYPRGYTPVNPDGKEIECNPDKNIEVEFLMREMTSM